MERAMGRVAALGTVGVVLLAGCAMPGPPPPIAPPGGTNTLAEPRPDWANGLPGLLPAIRACLDRSGQPAVGVTKAWPIAEDLAGVRLLGRGGERFDCVAEAQGGGVLRTEKVWTVSQLPGEREPLFTPASEAVPPSSACLAVSVARDGAGDGVGWLSYDVCRQPRRAEASADPARRGPLSGGNG
jgi:hypothetical protein